MADHQYIYHLSGLTKVWPGGRRLFENIHLSFLPDAKIGVVGINGAGKSTLLRIMAGEETAFDGEARPARGVKVGYLPQEPHLDRDASVWDNVIAHCPDKITYDAFVAASEKLADDYSEALLDEMNALQEKVEAANVWDIDSRIEMAMAALGCPDRDAPVSSLSGGEERRVALCRLLLSEPDMLLLDEPTNHLDAQTVSWLQSWLMSFKGCVVVITHDRYFLDQVTEWILELDRGRGIPFKGNYSAWLEMKAASEEKELRDTDKRNRKIARELSWVRSSPKARRAKSKARISAYNDLVTDAERQKKQTVNHIRIAPGPRLGDLVVEARNASVSRGGRMLMDAVSFRLPPGAIAGVVGPNGIGKTTLLRMISGSETPDRGDIRLGESVRSAHVDQSRASLTDTHNVWEEISGGLDILDIGGVDIHSRAYAGLFGFRGSDQQKKVGSLSGGERARLHMAKTLLTNANLLLLDEPTNDLDIETLQSLEAGLEDFPGCAVIVSHDRWFLDRVATHLIVFEGDGKIAFIEDNVSAWLDARAAAIQPDSAQRTRFSRS